MRLHFKRDRLWTPPEDRRLTIKFRGGMEATTKREWGQQMVDDGDADEIAAPARATDEPGSSRPTGRPQTAARFAGLGGNRDGGADDTLSKSGADES